MNDFHAISVADLPVKLGAHHVGFARGAVGAKGVPEIHMLMLMQRLTTTICTKLIYWMLKAANLIVFFGSRTLYTAAGETGVWVCVPASGRASTVFLVS